MTIENDNDIDSEETQEWLDSLAQTLKEDGHHRVTYLMRQMMRYVNDHGCPLAPMFNTAYKNTIKISEEVSYPGDLDLEGRVRAIIRWNAMAMVVRAVKKDPDIGGHIGSFASSAALYDVGFNHFWKAQGENTPGDLVYIQGHASPGIYARSFLEGVISEEQLENFRREIDHDGLSSYPHPWLMPNYWQFPTVSMGLGPLQAIYQARFTKYLENRDIIKNKGRKIWCFCGDGEMSEPESLGALTVAAREKLDNLIFVINCNLQGLDGPVRGNGKIIQELEGVFRGAGWHIIKVIWGGSWDPLFAKDHHGVMQKRMDEALDGDYQNYKAHGGAYTREHFFGANSELKEMVEHMSDEDIWRLKRGGHDPQKIYSAYSQAVKHEGQPVVILAKTVKGYGLGSAGEAMNTAHNTKKMAKDQLIAFRDRFYVPIPDDKIAEVPFYKPDADSAEIKYIKSRRKELGGNLPYRRSTSDEKFSVSSEMFKAFLSGSAEREISTTMVLVRILTALCKDKTYGNRVVPIIPDEARTFGMEGLFRQLGIYATTGQLYEPVDSAQVMFYKESQNGQILQEGINEGGAMCSWIAAATSYSNNNKVMIPFYIFYSMFGFQRTGDLAWAGADARSRGFLIGATSGRTTLNGEGLQHEDGHSHVFSSVIPNCKSYDPSFGFEVAVIVEQGLKEMLEDQKDVYYYITVLNETYIQAPIPDENVKNGIIKGIYCFKKAKEQETMQVDLLGSGAIFNEVVYASEILVDYGVSANLYSVPSFTELARDGRECTRYNRVNVDCDEREPYITQILGRSDVPVVVATDYVKSYPEQVREYVKRPYYVLGTDGFGRSSSRVELRRFFEVDRNYVAYMALYSLYEQGKFSKDKLLKARSDLGINHEKPDPFLV
ncbi:MAG: pyruvate dehydrogenase (acetyl-transferring), homodimeric type [Francisellaceae bacterium]|nr:pyruvate dehydrogenase (acetyl-transferring), homodimeric type [Francisellaceae bacterium]